MPNPPGILGRTPVILSIVGRMILEYVNNAKKTIETKRTILPLVA
jgi:hypothetical protein